MLLPDLHPIGQPGTSYSALMGTSSLPSPSSGNKLTTSHLTIDTSLVSSNLDFLHTQSQSLLTHSPNVVGPLSAPFNMGFNLIDYADHHPSMIMASPSSGSIDYLDLKPAQSHTATYGLDTVHGTASSSRFPASMPHMSMHRSFSEQLRSANDLLSTGQPASSAASVPAPPSRLRLQIPIESYYGAPGSPQVLSAITPSPYPPPTPDRSTQGPIRSASSSSQSYYPSTAENTGPRRFTCPHPGCARSFPRQYNLKSHMLCHSGAKPHVCQLCKAAFARKHDLQRHVRTLHSGTRPHECPICKQGFKRLDTLRKHLKTDEKAHLDQPEIRQLLLSIEAARAAEEEALKQKEIVGKENRQEQAWPAYLA